jgi:hypothetical protein
LLIAQSRKNKKEEGLKAFFHPNGPQGNPKHKRFVARGCLNKLFIYLVEYFLFIGIMTTSTSGSSNSACFTRFFDEDMKQEVSTMMDMVREMYEDERKSS